MDLAESTIYREVELNIVTVNPGDGAIGSGLSGCEVNHIDMSVIDVEQYLEARSLSDGQDAGEPFLRGRQITLIGTLYGLTRAALFDQLQVMRNAFSATSAARDDVPGETFSGAEAPTGHNGFLPLFFSVPTERLDDYPTGVIDLKVFAAPRTFNWSMKRKAQGRKTQSDQLAIEWQAVLLARDPRVYSAEVTAFNTTAGGSGHWDNRGDYESPINAFFVPANANAGTVTVTVDGTIFVIEIEAASAGLGYFYSGATKLVTKNGILRMDLITHTTPGHPAVQPGGADYSVVVAGATLTSGRLAFLEAYA